MSDRSKQAKSIFLEAIEKHAPEQWPAFLEQACAGDELLRAAVEKLLRAQAEMGSFHEEPRPPAGATVDDPVTERLGTVIGPYKLLQKIGEGGMGTVFMAEQTQPIQRKVALKVIKAGLDSGQVIARFEAERQALAMMDHVNIARVLDAGTTEAGLPYFVMELVHGVPITKYCDDNRLSPRERLELFVPVCQAIQHAHQKGIIHRDVKPSNVMITLYDGKPVPKVIDFGVAKATEQKLTERTLFTQYGTMVGTFEYMSPEQAEMSALGADTRSDIFSLGVLLYELLTGSTPLSHKRVKEAAYAEILRMIKEEEPPRPSTRLSDSGEALASISANRHMEPAKLTKLVRGELDWIVMKTLEKDRTRRYETVSAFAADVQRYLNDEPVQACPPSAWYRFSKFARRHKAMAAASGLAAFGVLLALVVFAAAFFMVSGALDSETNERKKAVKLAKDNELLAEKEGKARLEADQRREQAEALALRIQFEHYFSKAEDRPDLALVGMASLLPKAARLKDQSVADSLRWQIGAWSGQAARLDGIYTHNDRVLAVALSADGKIALTGSRDKTARLWETATGKPIGPPLQHQAYVVVVALSADGKTALTGSNDDTVRFWETATGKVVGLPLERRIGSLVALSADGKTALLTGYDTVLRLSEAATGKPIGPPLPGGLTLARVALSADGKIALTLRQDGTALALDTATGKLIGPPIVNQGGVGAIALSADGKIALTTGSNTARIWEPSTGKPIGPPMQHPHGVVAAALSADGATALTGSYDKTARFWDTASGKPIGPPMRHQADIAAADLSADGKTALIGNDDQTARLWQKPTVMPILPPTLHHESPVSTVALSADGKTALTGSDDKTARLWETSTGKPIGPSLQHQSRVVRVALSADGGTALTLSKDGTTRLWETATGKPIGLPLPLAGWKNSAATLSADGKTVLTVSYYPIPEKKEDGRKYPQPKLELWEAMTGKLIGPPLPHDPGGNAAALSADGKMALTVSGAKMARLWESATGKPIGPPLQLQAGFSAVALSADGKTALTGSGDKTARLWDTATGKPIGPPFQHQGEVLAVALSADGKTALTGSDDKTARLWETATGKPIGPPLQHQARVSAVALSADGKTALTSDETARLWKVPQPIRGDAQRIMLWSQVITGLEVDELTAVHGLDAATWQQRRQRLQELGGPLVE